MHSEHPHPLLAQIPLTLSPFLSLPTPTPLPYTYKSLPSTLPPSILSPQSSDDPTNPSQQQSSNPPGSDPHPEPAYITSPLNPSTRSTPTSILTSAHALSTHLDGLEKNAHTTVQAWKEEMRQRDLAEKRRIAPGWLDADVHLLVPENGDGSPAVMNDGGKGTGAGDRNVGGRNGGGRPEPAERRRSVGVKALVEHRDGVPDPRAQEELDRAFGGLGL